MAVSRTLAKSGAGGCATLMRRFHERERALVGISESGGKIGERCVEIILRLNLEELSLREIYIREADVQSGLEFIFLELGDLIRNQLAGFNSFLAPLAARLGL